MKAIKLIFGVLFILLGLAGTGFCIAGLVGMWRYKQPLTDWTERAAQQAEKTLGIVSRGLGELNKSLANARAKLDTINDAAAEKSPDSKDSRTKRMLARVAVSELGPRIGSARDTVDMVAEGSVVLNSMLTDLLARPQAKSFLDTDRLREISESLRTTAKASEEISGLLAKDDPNTKENTEAIQGKTSVIAEALEKIKALLGKCLEEIDAIRGDVARLTPNVSVWMSWGVWGLTVALIWIILGQLCLFVVGWRWLKTALKGPAPAKP
jgi:hypothetical protein